MPRSLHLLLAMIALAVLTCATQPAMAASEPRRPNVVLILTDNQNYHELSLHGHPIVQTPNIDSLAKEGIEFTNFHAPAFCSPSRAELLTGRYALRYGIYNTTGGVSILHKNEKTLADYLRQAGYTTGVFGKWHLGLSYPYDPQNRGFDETFVIGGGGIGQLEDVYGNTLMDTRFWHNGDLVSTQGFSTDVLFDQAIAFITKNKDRPFFCYIPTPALHTPLHFPHPAVAERMKARGVTGPFEQNEFEAYTLIENIDDNVGKILAHLRQLALLDHTIFIFTTDQGMRPRWKAQPTDTYPFPGKLDSSKVFYFFRYPPLIQKTGLNHGLSGMVDVVPTILDLCDLPLPADLDGRSQRALLTGAPQWDDERILIFQCPRHSAVEPWVNTSVKTQNFRMINGRNLYDAQTNAIVDTTFPEIKQRLIDTYNRFFASLPAPAAILSRHEIGPHPTRLCAMDWYKGDAPWGGGTPKSTQLQGTWAVEVTQPGRYRFELRRYPREAPATLSIGATRASLTIGDQTAQCDVPAATTAAYLELNLPAGKFDLNTTFTNPQNDHWGSYFVYISPAQNP